jgi:diacylglycerol kinase family enzyme
MMVVVSNTPYYGPAVELTPEARVDDRRFDVKVFNRFSRVELLMFAVQIATGRRPYHPKVQKLRGKSIAIASSRPIPAHADFEPVGHTPVTFRLVPAALRVRAHPDLWDRTTDSVVGGAPR